MRHVIIASIIGVLTIVVSIYILADSDDTYETDLKPDKTIIMGETFEGVNYNITPTDFVCQDYTALDDSDTRYGCVLFVKIENTTVFELVLVQGDDTVVSEGGAEFNSSGELSVLYVPDNELTEPIAVGESALGGIFFDVPDPDQLIEVQIQELTGADPITISL